MEMTLEELQEYLKKNDEIFIILEVADGLRPN